ncbi:MAG: peptidoglycan -binding protein [Paracoccaceae bacterium]
MALSRRPAQRISGSIWPGFVDAMTALLLVLMFVLTIFVVVQSMLRDTITGQESALDSLSAELDALAHALGLEQQRAFGLEEQASALDTALAEAQGEIAAQNAMVASLRSQIGAQSEQIAGFEAQIAAMLLERDTLQENLRSMETAQAELQSERDALDTALAAARTELDDGVEQARLAAARREALEALIADLELRADAQAEALSAAEQARIADAAAAEALRARLRDADAELTAMTLALEAERQRAEDTLTLLAAAEVASDDLTARLAAAVAARSDAEARAQTADEALATALAEVETLQGSAENEARLQADLAAALAAQIAAEEQALERLDLAEERALLLATANRALDEQAASTAESQRQVALLNAQVAELRAQLGALENILGESEDRDAAAQVQIESLTGRLNAALAQVATEERRRAALEEAERQRLEEEARRLERYQSEFFGRLRDILGEREGVQIVGDRFVFSSEVLFEPGSADLALEGRAQIAGVASILADVAGDIPPEIDWVVRVDGHTDRTPLSGAGRFADNWELSQARALSVVRFMTDVLGFPANRLAATGFGEYQPVNPGNSPAALAQNRRIELKLTEK